MARKNDKAPETDTRYHNTYKLLSNYRDAVWSMELSIEEMRREFQAEYESSVDEFLETLYMAGADLSGTRLERHARTIERSNEMIKLVRRAVDILRSKHMHGEALYWILYYSYLSPQKLETIEEIIEQLHPHIRDISRRTYFRKRKQAVEALSSILWGYSTRHILQVLDEFFPESNQK